MKARGKMFHESYHYKGDDLVDYLQVKRIATFILKQ